MAISQLATTATLALLLALPAQAVIVAQWNFNSPTPDSNPSTGSSAPSLGAGSAGLFGLTSFYFAPGAGSTDPAPADNTAWFTRPYPAQGTGDKAAGVVFTVTTQSFADIVLSWNQYHAANASKWVQVRYAAATGSPFQDVPGGLFSATHGGDTWYSRSVALGNLPGVDNAAELRLQIVPTFAPRASVFEASSAGVAYGPNGPLAYDMVTISGQVPEPSAFVLFLAGVGMVGLLIHTHRARRYPK